MVTEIDKNGIAGFKIEKDDKEITAKKCSEEY